VCFSRYFYASLTLLVGSRRLLPAVNKFLKKLVASVLFFYDSPLIDLLIDELLPALVASLIVLATEVAAVFMYFSKYFDYYYTVIYYFCIFFAWGADITY